MNNKLVIPKKQSTINRTIRFDGDIFDALSKMSDKSQVNFNKLVNLCLRYAVENWEMDKESK